MTDFEPLLNRWQSAGVLDAEAARRIRTYELAQTRPAGLRWQGMVALILGAILLACGVVLFVSAHWDRIAPGMRFALVIGMVTIFHLAGAFTSKQFRGLSTALHAVGTISTGAAIALVGQIFNIEEHWPAAVLLWTLAALAGWVLLQDEAQQILTLLLFPAWMLSELAFYADGHIGESVYLGRFLIVWAILYLTVFLGSSRKVVQGVLFSIAAVASVTAIAAMLEGWRAWSGTQTFLPLMTRAWGWTAIALLPLCFAAIRLRKSLLPVAAAVLLSLTLPWCMRTWTDTLTFGNYSRTLRADQPKSAGSCAGHGIRHLHHLVGCAPNQPGTGQPGNCGFAVSIAWFYFSDIFDKVGRSLGLIGLGVLFLAGGWALEKTRRGLLIRMGQPLIPSQEAK